LGSLGKSSLADNARLLQSGLDLFSSEKEKKRLILVIPSCSYIIAAIAQMTSFIKKDNNKK